MTERQLAEYERSALALVPADRADVPLGTGIVPTIRGVLSSPASDLCDGAADLVTMLVAGIADEPDSTTDAHRSAPQRRRADTKTGALDLTTVDAAKVAAASDPDNVPLRSTPATVPATGVEVLFGSALVSIPVPVIGVLDVLVSLPSGLSAHAEDLADEGPRESTGPAFGDAPGDLCFGRFPEVGGFGQGFLEARVFVDHLAFELGGHVSSIPDVSRVPDAHSDGPGCGR